MLPFSAMTIRKSGIRGCLPVWGGDGRQVSETLVRDNLDFPGEFWGDPSADDGGAQPEWPRQDRQVLLL